MLGLECGGIVVYGSIIGSITIVAIIIAILKPLHVPSVIPLFFSLAALGGIMRLMFLSARHYHARRLDGIMRQYPGAFPKS